MSEAAIALDYEHLSGEGLVYDDEVMLQFVGRSHAPSSPTTKGFHRTATDAYVAANIEGHFPDDFKIKRVYSGILTGVMEWCNEHDKNCEFLCTQLTVELESRAEHDRWLKECSDG